MPDQPTAVAFSGARCRAMAPDPPPIPDSPGSFTDRAPATRAHGDRLRELLSKGPI